MKFEWKEVSKCLLVELRKRDKGSHGNEDKEKKGRRELRTTAQSGKEHKQSEDRYTSNEAETRLS